MTEGYKQSPSFTAWAAPVTVTGEVSLVPGRDEAVVEVTLEMRHAIPLLSALVALAAAIYAFINYTNI